MVYGSANYTDTLVLRRIIKMADQSIRQESELQLWKRLSLLPYPTSEDASLNVYKTRLRESKRRGTLSAKKKRNASTGEVSDDFDWSSTVRSGVSRSQSGEHTLFHYLSSYRPSVSQERRTTETERARSLSVPASKLQLLEITSHQRNPGQRQHRAARDASTSFAAYQRKLPVLRQQSKNLINQAGSRRPCSDVPRPQPHPILSCRACSVKSCKIFCKQCQ